METKNEAVMAKIKKLFSLAYGSDFEEEAYSALTKAQDLMIEYGISQAQVDATDLVNNEEAVVLGTGNYGKRTSAFHWQAAQVIAENTRCFTWRTRVVNSYGYAVGYEMMFLGTAMDSQIASASFTFCIKEGTRGWHRFWRKKTNYDHRLKLYNGIMTEYRDGYYLGFVRGLKTAYSNNIESRALILVKPDTVIESYEEKKKKINSVRTREISSISSDSYEAGLADGQSVLNKRQISA
jgi:hypothetical protein